MRLLAYWGAASSPMLCHRLSARESTWMWVFLLLSSDESAHQTVQIHMMRLEENIILKHFLTITSSLSRRNTGSIWTVQAERCRERSKRNITRCWRVFISKSLPYSLPGQCHLPSYRETVDAHVSTNIKIRAKTHLRVTGYKHHKKRIFQGFFTFREAEEFMSQEGIKDYDLDIASPNENTCPMQGNSAYYAVAYGRRSGIYKYYE